MLLIVMLKIRYNMNIVVLRGTHECEKMMARDGFAEEIKKKFGQDSDTIPDLFIALFAALPVTAVSSHTFCVHGGLSQRFRTTNQMQTPNRFVKTTNVSKTTWTTHRQGPHTYTNLGTTMLLSENALELIVRANEITRKGYKKDHDEGVLTLASLKKFNSRSTELPNCVT
ncbi:unnamed protein product [Caenorhabditis nigoni]